MVARDCVEFCWERFRILHVEYLPRSRFFDRCDNFKVENTLSYERDFDLRSPSFERFESSFGSLETKFEQSAGNIGRVKKVKRSSPYLSSPFLPAPLFSMEVSCQRQDTEKTTPSVY